MAFTTVVTHATGDVLPASDWNTYVRDNMAYLHGDAGSVLLNADVGNGGGVTLGGTPGTLLDNAGVVYVATALATSGVMAATVQGDTTDWRFAIWGDGSIHWSSGAGSRDVNLYRGNVGQLKTDSVFYAVNGYIAQATSGNNMLRNFLLAADAQPAFTILGNGTITWGPGGSTVADTSLSRSSAGILNAGNKLVESAPATTSQAAGTTFTPSLANGLVQRVNVTTTGTLTIGSPGAPPAGNSCFLVVVVKAAAATTTTVAWNAIFNSATGSPSTGGGLAYLWFYDQGTSKWVFLLASTE